MPAASPPQCQVTTERSGNRVTVEVGPAEVRFDIFSTRGIGSAAVQLGSGALPPRVLLRFYLQGLEQMRFEYSGRTVTVSVLSHGDKTMLESLTSVEGEARIERGSPFWIEVTHVPADGPGSIGYYDVVAPADFFEAAAASFRVDWIDFFR